MVAREPGVKEIVDDIYRAYHEQGEPATGSKGQEPDDNEPTIQPMTRARARKRKRCNPKGPIGLRLETLYLNAACMNAGYQITTEDHPALDVLNHPYQVISDTSRQIAVTHVRKKHEA